MQHNSARRFPLPRRLANASSHTVAGKRAPVHRSFIVYGRSSMVTGRPSRFTFYVLRFTQNVIISRPKVPFIEGESRVENKSERIDKVFKAAVAVMLAIVTVAGAYVAWRASITSNESGLADAKGLRAALNVEETTSLNYIVSNQHRDIYTDYYTERLIAFAEAAGGKLDSTPPDKLPEVVRDITERLDLATTDKLFFFPARYLNQDDTYNIGKEQ